MWYLHHILATQSSLKNTPAKKKTAWTEKNGCFVFGSSSDEFSSFWRDVFSGSSRSWSSWVSMIFHQTWLLTHLGLVGFTLIFPTLKTAKGLQTPGLALLPNRAIPLVFFAAVWRLRRLKPWNTQFVKTGDDLMIPLFTDLPFLKKLRKILIESSDYQAMKIV